MDNNFNKEFVGWRVSMDLGKEPERRIVHEKPPIGLMPKEVHDKIRALDIIHAIERYVDAGKKVPPEWISELSLLLSPYPCGY